MSPKTPYSGTNGPSSVICRKRLHDDALISGKLRQPGRYCFLADVVESRNSHEICSSNTPLGEPLYLESSHVLLTILLPSCNPNKTAAGRMDRAEDAINTAPENVFKLSRTGSFPFMNRRLNLLSKPVSLFHEEGNKITVHRWYYLP